ncbi:MAG: hypothetical protein M1826_003978 [Phylliscum demangeonii]|nr:MAG: hypothetical protein M1826_003978 [Phylliscum demangeonii]
MPALEAVAQSEDKFRPDKPTLTPPASVKLPKFDDASSSDLSDLEDHEDADLGEILPDHYYGSGKIPVFKPTMDQFRSFKKFIDKINKYGMKSGIIKVIPPKEWREAMPPLDEAVKAIKVKNPITQEIAGSSGIYRQANIEKQRSYNLPQWRQLCEGSEHQPPARRGERRRNQPAAARAAAGANSTRATRQSARARKTSQAPSVLGVGGPAPALDAVPSGHDPPTPTSPNDPTKDEEGAKASTTVVEAQPAPEDDELGEAELASPGKGKGRQPKSVSSRRKYNRRAAADHVDEAAFEQFDYRITNHDDYTPERCEELERHYWKSITYNSPLYGADMPGSLFDPSTTSWNVAKLENLLDVLGQEVPGVNTAYLYLGMWKSTFAWHLEDVDLYSINYIHFGAPKQWYSISQEDARRFEAAMKRVWPGDAKTCSQFLRHKTYLISPTLLQSQFNIRVNRLVHHEGEFVITFPYGYHSGYNLGYNCAESVNFATESWLEFGRVAKKCNCTDDSVWVDVDEIERKLRGEIIEEYLETDDDVDADADADADDDGSSALAASDLPTPPASSVDGKSKPSARKRKTGRAAAPRPAIKRIRVRIKDRPKEPCVLCPNDIPSEQLLPADNGKEAHRLCALYIPETYVQGAPGAEMVYNLDHVDKARLDLKCHFCRQRRGACFQCSAAKCIRAYHATCAAAAGVLVDMRDIVVVGEDGQETADVGIDFRCRYHRSKRAKNLDGDVLEESQSIRDFARVLQVGDVIQMQYFQGGIFAGAVVENRVSEHMVLVDLLPRGDRVEVEFKWILVPDAAEINKIRLPASPQAKRKRLRLPSAKRPVAGAVPGDSVDNTHPVLAWHDPHTVDLPPNADQVPVDFSKPNSTWHYLGSTSTEARAQYTEDPQKAQHNAASNFLGPGKARTPAVTPSPATIAARRVRYPQPSPASNTGAHQAPGQAWALPAASVTSALAPPPAPSYAPPAPPASPVPLPTLCPDCPCQMPASAFVVPPCPACACQLVPGVGTSGGDEVRPQV